MKIIRSKEKLRAKESLLIEENEIFSVLTEKKGSSLFLGKYSLNQVVEVLRKKNLFKDAQKRKLWPLDFEMDSSEFPPLQRFQIFYKTKKPENLIVDLKIREGSFRPKDEIALNFSIPEFRFLMLEWLTLQNPLLRFSHGKTPLPGQVYPGLNLGKKIMDIFTYLARLSNNDGILAFPAYFHNALLFSRNFRFFNPEKKGEILAVRKSFPDVPFKKLAWIVHLNCLRKGDGSTYEWKAEEQVYPMNKTLRNYLNSREYKKKVMETEREQSYFIDWECYRKKAREAGVVS